MVEETTRSSVRLEMLPSMISVCLIAISFRGSHWRCSDKCPARGGPILWLLKPACSQLTKVLSYLEASISKPTVGAISSASTLATKKLLLPVMRRQKERTIILISKRNKKRCCLKIHPTHLIKRFRKGLSLQKQIPRTSLNQRRLEQSHKNICFRYLNRLVDDTWICMKVRSCKKILFECAWQYKHGRDKRWNKYISVSVLKFVIFYL